MKPPKTLKQLLEENRQGFRSAELLRQRLRERIHQEVWGIPPVQPLEKQQTDLPPKVQETINRRFWEML